MRGSAFTVSATRRQSICFGGQKFCALVKKVLRHASITTTEKYADVMEDEIRRSLDGLFA